MIRIFNNLDALSRAAAGIFVESAAHAIHARGRFSVALSGGSTPHRLYELLAAPPFRGKVAWESVHFFWGDERCVPEDDPRRNELMARQALLEHVPVLEEHIHPISGSLPPREAAQAYESELRRFFAGRPPALDLVLLGMGANAHTASLFPHTAVLHETRRWAAEVFVAELDMYRVTLTASLINQAEQVVFLVSGEDKALTLQNVLEGAHQPDELPAQLIQPNGAHPIWLVDRAAGHKLAMPLESEIED